VRRHRVPRRHLVVLLIVAAAVLIPAVVVPLVLLDKPTGDSSTDLDPAAGASATTVASATPTASTAATTPVASEVPVASTQPGDGGPPPPMLVYQAEGGTVRLSRAEVVTLGGGAGVKFTSRSGEIEFESLDVPTRDRYRVTIFYAVEGEWSLELDGSQDEERVGLDRTSGCCASVTVDIRLSPGGDLSIGPSRGDGPLPTIDRILIDPI
jgi:hypothetical protein